MFGKKRKVYRICFIGEAGKHHETSAMMTKRLRQIIDKMEARTREALKLARELEELFGVASPLWIPPRSPKNHWKASPEYPASQTCKAREVSMDRFGMM